MRREGEGRDGSGRYSKVGVHEMGHQSCVCAQQFQRTKNHTAATLRFANSVHVT